jgi:hypothetical protein
MAGAGVPDPDPGADVGFEGLDALVDATADQLAGQEAEPSLDLVDPGRSGRGEMHVEARMAGQPFTHWSVRKLAAHLALTGTVVSRERLRQLLRERGISFQRTRTWKESHDPDKHAKLDRIEHVTSAFPDRCFAFDQFGPLSIRPCHGTSRAPRKKPERLPATYHRTHGIRYFHGCCSLADDQLWGVTRRRKGGDRTLAALQSIRAARPGGYRLLVILDNLSANKTRPSGPGPGGQASSCASRRRAHRGPTRSRPSSARCGPSSWAAPATRTTQSSPGGCRTTCAGATPTPATPTSWPPSAASAPASALNASSAGAAPRPKPHDQTRRTLLVSALGNAGKPTRGARQRRGCARSCVCEVLTASQTADSGPSDGGSACFAGSNTGGTRTWQRPGCILRSQGVAMSPVSSAHRIRSRRPGKAGCSCPGSRCNGTPFGWSRPHLVRLLCLLRR